MIRAVQQSLPPKSSDHVPMAVDGVVAKILKRPESNTRSEDKFKVSSMDREQIGEHVFLVTQESVDEETFLVREGSQKEGAIKDIDKSEFSGLKVKTKDNSNPSSSDHRCGKSRHTRNG